MRINGSMKKLDALELSHKGNNLKFRWFCGPESPFDNPPILEEPTRLKIEFSDLREVDSIIEALTRFRDETAIHIGEFRPELCKDDYQVEEDTECDKCEHLSTCRCRIDVTHDMDYRKHYTRGLGGECVCPDSGVKCIRR